QVIPANSHAHLAFGEVGVERLAENKVAGFLELGEEVDAGFDVAQGTTVSQGGREDGGERLACLPRVVAQGDLALEGRAGQVRPVLGRVLDGAVVRHEGNNAIVVPIPETGGLFHVGWNRIPGGYLVRNKEAAGRAGRGPRGGDVNHVRGAVEALEILNRGNFGRRAAVRVGVSDMDPVASLERVHDLAVVRPVDR